MELIVSLLAALISVISLVWSIRTSLNQREGAAIIANLTNIAEIEATLGQVPTALRFHGIDLDELESYGVTPQEFAYVVSNFAIGGVYYRSSPQPENLLKSGSYRYEMCKAEATRKVWPILRRMLSPSPYRTHLDEIFSELNRSRNR